MRNRLVWIVPIGMALGVTAIWWSIARPRLFSEADPEPASSDPGGITSKETRRDPVAFVSRFVGKADAASMNELVQIYSKWARYPETLDARKMAVEALLAHPNINVGLEAVLAAVEADPTRKEQDPMWPHLVRNVTKLWDAVTFSTGRDRMYIEERAKPRDLLLESLMNIRGERLADDQRSQLVADFIDLYSGLKPEQKPAADRALTDLGSRDLVEILSGRGLGENSHLNVVADRNKAIEAARAIRVPAPPPAEEDPVPRADPGNKPN